MYLKYFFVYIIITQNNNKKSKQNTITTRIKNNKNKYNPSTCYVDAPQVNTFCNHQINN